MRSLDELYKGRFFARRHKLGWRVPYVCKAVYDAYHPKSLIDVGCAIGEYVKGFLEMGVDAFGLEGTENALPYLEVPVEKVFIGDLRKPLKVCRAYFGHFDVALCLEVAEHIEPEYADQFVENLVNLSKSIVMSFAPPGQLGHGHFNCQEAPYWIEKFAKHGYVFRHETVEKVRAGLEPVKAKREIRSYYNHLLCFEG